VFSAEIDPSGEKISVVSEAFAERFGAGAVDVGKPLAINGVWTTVGGVLPRRFKGTDTRPTGRVDLARHADEILRTAQTGAGFPARRRPPVVHAPRTPSRRDAA
jgi:hypothetical protein